MGGEGAIGQLIRRPVNRIICGPVNRLYAIGQSWGVRKIVLEGAGEGGVRWKTCTMYDPAERGRQTFGVEAFIWLSVGIGD